MNQPTIVNINTKDIHSIEETFSNDLIHNMLDPKLHEKMLDIVDVNDEEDYSAFNDIEMMYLFVHEERDLDVHKNRTEQTKKEYLRELLWMYHLFVAEGLQFDFDSTGLDVATVLKRIKPRHIRKFQQWMTQAPLGKGGKRYSVATISRKTSIFKAFISYLHDKKYIQHPLHESFKSAAVHMADRPDRDLYADEAIELLNYYKEHPILHGLLSVLLTTGARVAELCAARICDLSYDNDGYWLEVIGKGNKKRELFIFPAVYEAIVTFRQRRQLNTKLDKQDASPIFVTARHKPYSYKYLSNYLSNALSKADLSFVADSSRTITPHTLRHGFAIISAEEGADVFRIQQALGHENIATTMIYLEKQQKRKNHVAHTWKDSSVIKGL
ncbi:tyrosine-type recombinase/integrase [Lentibacillus saliphilus]|uniref:tyrosine-type recombinase/integrase n=1 Tax=Lentibacillus saliphilus TaxID=2737028 RepID=UPI001C309F71|nr:tyrosine-type recombinase/integrase [Lentibacillus saliphilus]